VDDCLVCRVEWKSSTLNNKYQVSHKHSGFSWWCAHSRPKHVEIDKYTRNKLYTSWLYLQDYTGMHGKQNVKLITCVSCFTITNVIVRCCCFLWHKVIIKFVVRVWSVRFIFIILRLPCCRYFLVRLKHVVWLRTFRALITEMCVSWCLCVSVLYELAVFEFLLVLLASVLLDMWLSITRSCYVTCQCCHLCRLCCFSIAKSRYKCVYDLCWRVFCLS